MVTLRTDTCDRYKKPNPINFKVTPEEAWKIVVLNRWKKLCPPCFDQLAEGAAVRYGFAELEGQSWSGKPVPSSQYRRRR